MKKWIFFGIIISIIACTNYKQLPIAKSDWRVKALPATPQQTGGDPTAGFDYLVNGNYIGSGIPFEDFKKKLLPTPDTVLGRSGDNKYVPYAATVFEAPNGAKVINGNCFTCHASEFNGQIVLGLGNSFSDYEKSLAPMAKLMNLGMRVKHKKESEEFQAFKDFGQYFKAMAPYIETNQPGANPAFRLAEACMMYRNPTDLTYQENPNYEMEKYTVATDVPPLWNVKKKNTLYFTGIGRGDFTKLLFQASVLGIPDSTAARHAINNFKDVLAWLNTLEPPAYPKPIDTKLANQGSSIFKKQCSKCHGTYGSEESYPNKVVSLDLIKTDPAYAQYAHNSGIVDWYNNSWFAQSEPRSYFEPVLGYVAPPLDGIWASAPYLHNGSVPNLQAVLDSKQRPTYWQRSGESTDYDFEKMGWSYVPKDNGRGKWTFNTTLPGYGNQGHYFGDKLTREDRKALIEYLKTL